VNQNLLSVQSLTAAQFGLLERASCNDGVPVSSNDYWTLLGQFPRAVFMVVLFVFAALSAMTAGYVEYSLQRERTRYRFRI